MRKMAEEQHKGTHWGIESMAEASKPQVLSVKVTGIIKSITKKCQTCLKNNTHQIRQPTSRTVRKGSCHRLISLVPPSASLFTYISGQYVLANVLVLRTKIVCQNKK